MTDSDRLRLARLVQFRELITLIFRDPTPWGESLPVQVLADFLEAEGAHDVADAVRGRFVTDIFGEWQVTEISGRYEMPEGSGPRRIVERANRIDVKLEAGMRKELGDYTRKQRPKE